MFLIQDLQVKTSPPAQLEERVYDDPAVIQVLFHCFLACALVIFEIIKSILVQMMLGSLLHHHFQFGARSLMETMQWQDTPPVASLTLPRFTSFLSISRLPKINVCSSHSTPFHQLSEMKNWSVFFMLCRSLFLFYPH